MMFYKEQEKDYANCGEHQDAEMARYERLLNIHGRKIRRHKTQRKEAGMDAGYCNECFICKIQRTGTETWSVMIWLYYVGTGTVTWISCWNVANIICLIRTTISTVFQKLALSYCSCSSYGCSSWRSHLVCSRLGIPQATETHGVHRIFPAYLTQ